MTPDGPAASHRVDYGSDESQFAELLLPAGDDVLPVVMIVHGGAWLDLFGLEFGRPLAEDLVRSGAAAYNVEYRRVGHGDGGGGGWPHTGEDVVAAFDALSMLAPRLRRRLDLSNIVLLGHSAGAQLSLWVVHQLSRRPRPRSQPLPHVSGVVLQAGMLDLVEAAHVGAAGDAVPPFLGGQPAELPTTYAQASPISHLPTGMPIVCVHGDADDVVPLDQSQRYVEAARTAGDRPVLHIVPGADHFEPITVGTRAWNLTRSEVLRLLQARPHDLRD